MSAFADRAAAELTGPQAALPLGTTTARVERPGQRPVALALATELGVRFVERRERGVERTLDEEGLASLVVVSAEGIFWQPRAGGRFFFHPNMAFVRIRSAERSGLADPLVRAARIAPGDRVLDATLGLGADAIVVSHTLGAAGTLVGIEASPLIAALVRRGLATYPHRLAPALRRIEVVRGDHRALLADPAWAGGGWDAILFDPMFERTVSASNGLDGVRLLACYDRLAPATLAAARRLVRKAVVVKGRREDGCLASLGPDHIVHGRHNRVAYGVFEPLV